MLLNVHKSETVINVMRPILIAEANLKIRIANYKPESMVTMILFDILKS